MAQGESSREKDGNEPRLSRACVGRLSLYLRRLEGFRGEGTKIISSNQLGMDLGIRDAQVRKDLAYLGNLGLPGVGYPIPELIAALRRTLGINRDWAVALVGVGNLARALLRYRGFLEQGFRIVALFDSDPPKIGQQVDGLTIHSPDHLGPIIKAAGAELGLLTVPSEAAQGIADALVAAGIRGILNFAPVVLRLPRAVRLVNVDLAIQMEQLAFLVQGEAGEPGPQAR